MCAIYMLLVQLVYGRDFAKHLVRSQALNRVETQIEHLDQIIGGSDRICIEQLRNVGLEMVKTKRASSESLMYYHFICPIQFFTFQAKTREAMNRVC